MPTFKQRKAIKNLAENGGIVSKAMIDAGYSKATAKTPRKLTESKGFAMLLEEYGLTKTFIGLSLMEDIKRKPQNRIAELTLAADILKMRNLSNRKRNVIL